VQKIDQVRREHYAVWRDPDLAPHRLGRLGSLLAGLDVDTYRVTESSYACGRSLAELDLRRAAGASTLGLVRDGATLASPGVEITVRAGDTLVLLGTNVQVERALAILDTGAPPPAG